jgi:hypothetical protein
MKFLSASFYVPEDLCMRGGFVSAVRLDFLLSSPGGEETGGVRPACAKKQHSRKALGPTTQHSRKALGPTTPNVIVAEINHKIQVSQRWALCQHFC